MNDYFNVRSFGAVGDGVANDTAAIQATINALPSGGGVVYFPPGTYKITSTLTLPDKDVIIEFSAGAKVVVSGGIPAFTIPNGLTALRNYHFTNPSVIMTGAAGQEFLRIADTSGLLGVIVDNAYIFKPETLVNFTGYDTTYSFSSKVQFNGGSCIPNGLNSFLAKTPNPAGSYAGAVVLSFFGCNLIDELINVFAQLWFFNIDGDFVSITLDGDYGLAIKQGSACGGVKSQGTLILGDGDLTIFGQNWISNHSMSGVINGTGANARIIIHGLSTLIYNAICFHIAFKTASYGNISFRSALMYDAVPHSVYPAIELTVDEGTVDDCVFRGGWTNGCVKITDAKFCKIHDNNFRVDTIGPTVVETGAADKNIIHACTGIDSGTGFDIPGVNSLVGADNIG